MSGKDKQGSSKISNDFSSLYLSTAHLALASIFLISAYLNLNDPDPLLWIGLYLFSAFLCFWTFLNVTKILPKPSIPLAVPLVWAVIILFVAFYVYKSVPYSPGNLWEFLEMEEGREMGGLSIILFEVGLIIVTLQETSSKPTFWSWISRGYYFSAFSIVSLSFYILLFLQPQLNEKLRVEHCSGILY